MSVHSNVIARHQLAVVKTVVPAGVLLAHRDDDQALLAGDDVFLRTEGDGVAALGLAVVMPLQLVAAGHISQAGAGQVNALPEVGDEFPFEGLGVAEAGLGAGGVVEEVGLENTKLQNPQVKALCQMLEKCSGKLKSLELGANNLSLTGSLVGPAQFARAMTRLEGVGLDAFYVPD